MDDDIIDLIPEAALAEANAMGSKTGVPALPSPKAFGKLLRSKNWIAEKSQGRNTINVRVGDVVIGVWRVHAFRLFEECLDWGDFDLGTYSELKGIEREQERKRVLEQRRIKLRDQLTTYQFDKLLNPVLTEADRSKILYPDPIPGNARNDSSLETERSERWIPPPPRAPQLPGYVDLREEDLIV